MGLGTFLGRGHPPTHLRGAQFLAFSETALLQSGTVTSDLGGGGTTVWAAAGTMVCKIASIGGSPNLTAGRMDESSTHVVSTSPNVTVNTGQRVVVRGGTFGITHVYDGTDARTTRFEAILL